MGKFPLLPTDGQFVQVPHRYWEGSGLNAPKLNESLILYKREGVIDQWDKLNAWSVELHAITYVVGSPGTGKSSAAFAFACGHVDRTQWTVIWIHWSDKCSFHVVVFEVEHKKMTTFGNENLIQDVLYDLENQQDKKVLVFFDGFVPTSNSCKEAKDKLTRWQEGATHQRHLVCITSAGAVKLKGHKTRDRITSDRRSHK